MISNEEFFSYYLDFELHELYEYQSKTDTLFMALMETAIYGLERDKWGGSWPRDGSPLTIIGLIKMFISKPRYDGKTLAKLKDLLNDYKTNLKLKQSFVNNVLSRNKVPNINNHKAKK